MRKIRMIMILLSSVLTAALISACGAKGITGDEWLLKQDVYIDDIQAFSEGMDEVYTLYTSGYITGDDFYQELQVLKGQYSIMQMVYEKEKKENPVLPETYSYAAQRGVEGIEKVRTILGEILEESTDKDGLVLSSEDIAYMYLTKRAEINENLAVYLVAYNWISEGGEITITDDQTNETAPVQTEVVN